MPIDSLAGCWIALYSICIDEFTNTLTPLMERRSNSAQSAPIHSAHAFLYLYISLHVYTHTHPDKERLATRVSWFCLVFDSGLFLFTIFYIRSLCHSVSLLYIFATQYLSFVAWRFANCAKWKSENKEIAFHMKNICRLLLMVLLKCVMFFCCFVFSRFSYLMAGFFFFEYQNDNSSFSAYS